MRAPPIPPPADPPPIAPSEIRSLTQVEVSLQQLDYLIQERHRLDIERTQWSTKYPQIELAANTVTRLQQCVQSRSWQQQLKTAEESLVIPPTWIPGTQPDAAYLTQLQQHATQLTRISTTQQMYTSQLSQIKADLAALPTVTPPETLTATIAEKVARVASLRELHRSGTVVLGVLRDYVELQSFGTQIVDINTRVQILKDLRRLIDEVTDSSLQELVEDINATTNTILKEIFEDDITITLSLYKELKKKDVTGQQVIRPQVNIQISYRGHVYDKPDYLSGGEKDRISLALTVALSRVSGSTFLLLDECTSSLDGTPQEWCTLMLRKFCEGKTVVNVCHETVEGVYDQVVTITH